MLDVLDQALSWGGRSQADRLGGQGSIFDLDGGGAEEAAPKHHPEIPAREFEKNELLRLEKEVLGLYVSEHPLNGVRDQLRRKTDCGLSELERRRDGEIVTVGGIVGAVKQLTTKKGEPMVFMRLDDLVGGCEVVVFNSVYAAARELLVPDAVLVVKARVDHKEGETKLIALEVSEFSATPERREVRLRIDTRRASQGLLRDLAAVLGDFPGDALVYADLITSEGPKVFEFGPKFKVQPVPDFFAEVKALLGEAAVA
jgi:DNA polymerase-3 subunit alpha